MSDESGGPHMDEETWFCVELVNTEGDETFTVLRDPDALANFVRVNAQDASYFKVSAVTPSNLAQSRITETFADA